MSERPTGNKTAGNLVGWLWQWADQLPPAAWTHAIAFLAGVIFALVLAIAITVE